MAGNSSSQKRTITSEFSPVTSLLSKKQLPKQNIVVGDDPAQISWLEQRLGLPATPIDKVTDEAILGIGPALLRVHMDNQVDISPQVRDQVGIWAAHPLTKGSAGLSALIKFALPLAELSPKQLPKEYLQLVTNAMSKDTPSHILSTVWNVCWILTAPLTPREWWKEPWEEPMKWLPAEVDPAYRLHSLYRTLVGYVYTIGGNKDGAQKMGIKPSRQKKFEALKLPEAKVVASIRELSRWKYTQTSPYQCALVISAIWSK